MKSVAEVWREICIVAKEKKSSYLLEGREMGLRTKPLALCASRVCQLDGPPNAARGDTGAGRHSNRPPKLIGHFAAGAIFAARPLCGRLFKLAAAAVAEKSRLASAAKWPLGAAATRLRNVQFGAQRRAQDCKIARLAN